MTKQTDSVHEFDFGFSFVDDENHKEVQDKLQEQCSSNQQQIQELESRIALLYKSILPFLDNLCSNPDKPTIHWPDRVEKIQQYKSRLKQISEGKQPK